MIDLTCSIDVDSAMESAFNISHLTNVLNSFLSIINQQGKEIIELKQRFSNLDSQNISNVISDINSLKENQFKLQNKFMEISGDTGGINLFSVSVAAPSLVRYRRQEQRGILFH
jgi:hypothetical protein